MFASVAASKGQLVGLSVPLAAQHGRMKSSQSQTAPPAAVMVLNLSTATLKELEPYPMRFLTTETVLDARHHTLYLVAQDIVRGAVLKVLNLVDGSWQASVALDTSHCESGSGCFEELHWDDVNQRIVGLAVGFRSGPGTPTSNAVVAIDPSSGKVTLLSRFPETCALYMQSSTFDSAAQSFYGWVGCENAPTAQLVSWSVADPTRSLNTTLLDVEEHNISAPCVFVPGRGLVGVSADGRLVQISRAKGGTHVTALTGALGGIVSNGGLALSHNTSVAVVYATLMNEGANELVRVELPKASPARLSRSPLKFSLQYVHIDDAKP